MSAVVMSVNRKPPRSERLGDMVVSAQVLAHAMNKHDDARTRLAPISSPATADKLPAVRGTVGERVGVHHRGPLSRGHREIGQGAMSITVITLEWSDRSGQVSGGESRLSGHRIRREAAA